jgi:hypothetical protein
MHTLFFGYFQNKEHFKSKHFLPNGVSARFCTLAVIA